MFSHQIKKLPKNTVEISVKITKDEVNKEYQKAFESLSRELTVEGFRKGNAPKAIAQKHIKKEDVYQQLLRDLLPRVYDDIVRKEALKPIISPKIELVNSKENEDWQILIKLAEKPLINLGDYKALIKEVKSKNKKEDIWVPGKDKTKNDTQTKMNKQKLLNEILTELLKKVKCEISDLIIEAELEQRLSKLLDDIQKIGLTVEAYLKSKGTNIDQLKQQFAREIEDTYKLEFILTEIANEADIKVEQSEIDKLLANLKDEKERELARQNSYFYATILRKQKTLDFLTSL